MSTATIHVFLSGAISFAALVAGLFFAKYWAISRDRFFLFFAAAFWIMAANWMVLATIGPRDETRHYFYIVRLAAFLLILIGIIDKNRRR